MHSQPGIRVRGYAQSGPPRSLLLRGTRNPIFGGLDPPSLGGYTLELCRDSWPPSGFVDPHPDPGGAHEVCPCTQTIKRGTTRPLPGEMTGRICPHLKRQGRGDICLPRPDPPDPKPGDSSHMPPHAGTNTVLPDPSPYGPARRSLDPTPSETPPHNAGDTYPNATMRPGHTAKPEATRQT